MIKFDGVTKENKKEHNPNWPQVLYHHYRILIIGVLNWILINPLFNLISYQPDINKILFIC